MEVVGDLLWLVCLLLHWVKKMLGIIRMDGVVGALFIIVLMENGSKNHLEMRLNNYEWRNRLLRVGLLIKQAPGNEEYFVLDY